MTLTSSGDRSRAACGYGILFIIGIFELVVLIIGAISYGGQANIDCDGSVKSITLPLWLMIGGIIGFCMNTLYLCLYTPSVCCDEFCDNGRSDTLGGMVVCMITGPPLIIMLLTAVFFRIAWFVVGCIELGSVPAVCNVEHDSLKILAIFYLVSMVISTFGKMIVSMSVCPCCK